MSISLPVCYTVFSNFCRGNYTCNDCAVVAKKILKYFVGYKNGLFTDSIFTNYVCYMP